MQASTPTSTLPAPKAGPRWGPLVRERVALFVGFVILVAVNATAGRSNARISNAFFTPITPAGWTFAVWGLIFFLQARGRGGQGGAWWQCRGGGGL